MPDDLKIEDLIPYLNTNKTLFVYAGDNGGGKDEWIEGTVHGINLVENQIYFLPNFWEGDLFHCQWFPLFYQLIKSRPKFFKVKLS